MGTVLYEATGKFDASFLIPLILLAFIVIIPFIIKKRYQNKEGINLALTMKIVKICCCCAGAFVILLSLIVLIGQLYMYNKTVGAYNRGDYEIIEGYVENFDPMPYEGHANESFEINGVKFEYSDYDVIQGYNNTKSHGGVITHNGQHLKIGYVKYGGNYGNIIVYIEQLP